MIQNFRNILSHVKNKLTVGIPILLYHRVAEIASDPQLLCVTPQHFSEHLEVIRKNHIPISLDELVIGDKARSFDPNRIAITFDDGYADNLINAKPLLERYNVLATVFITGAYIDGVSEFWWDELERIVLQPGSLPSKIELNVDGKRFFCDVSETQEYTKKDFLQFHTWNVLETKDMNSRSTLYRLLCQFVHLLSNDECQKVLEDLRALANVSPEGRATHYPISADEIILLVKDGLIKVGAHTMTHPVLASLPIERQRDELNKNKVQLEDILGDKVVGFSYPYGGKGDYTMATRNLVQEAGFLYACANYPGQARRWTDPFELPRFLVRDWDGDEFARQLQIFLHQ
jgi:peptidoglycan/xylan/chitin deacetylase (PgdA/CDA1 family)